MSPPLWPLFSSVSQVTRLYPLPLATSGKYGWLRERWVSRAIPQKDQGACRCTFVHGLVTIGGSAWHVEHLGQPGRLGGVRRGVLSGSGTGSGLAGSVFMSEAFYGLCGVEHPLVDGGVGPVSESGPGGLYTLDVFGR